MSAPEFRRNFDPQYGEAIAVADGVQRVVAANPSPFTFKGTNTYIIGSADDRKSPIAIVDPGPGADAAPDHIENLQKAIDGRHVSHIVITHTHRDHTGHVGALKSLTNAPVLAFGPHLAARPLADGEINVLDAAGDTDLAIDEIVTHGRVFGTNDWTLEAIHTPGHTENHLAFALRQNGKPTNILFSGDHIMGWATTIVAPPDGHMGHYMRSLETLLQRDETLYFPGHGGRIEDAHKYVRGVRSHRLMREAAILKEMKEGNRQIVDIVKKLYADVPIALHGAAALSVQAHVEHLHETGKV